jgi:hypothetical protein
VRLGQVSFGLFPWRFSSPPATAAPSGEPSATATKGIAINWPRYIELNIMHLMKCTPARGSAQRHIVSIPAIALSATLAVRTAWTIRSCRAIYGGDRVHQHLAIWTRIGGEIRCAYGSGLEHRIEDVCDVCQVSELAFRVCGVKEIDGDVTVAWPSVVFRRDSPTTRQSGSSTSLSTM